jgi:ATP sulfurylase
MLVNEEEIPAEFSRPEVVKVLREFYANQDS